MEDFFKDGKAAVHGCSLSFDEMKKKDERTKAFYEKQGAAETAAKENEAKGKDKEHDAQARAADRPRFIGKKRPHQRVV